MSEVLSLPEPERWPSTTLSRDQPSFILVAIKAVTLTKKRFVANAGHNNSNNNSKPPGSRHGKALAERNALLLVNEGPGVRGSDGGLRLLRSSGLHHVTPLRLAFSDADNNASFVISSEVDGLVVIDAILGIMNLLHHGI